MAFILEYALWRWGLILSERSTPVESCVQDRRLPEPAAQRQPPASSASPLSGAPLSHAHCSLTHQYRRLVCHHVERLIFGNAD